MPIIALLILVLGLFAFFNTSKRAGLGGSGIEKLLQKNRRLSKTIGAISVLVSFILLINSLGWAVGIFYTLIALMTVLSLLVLLVPLIKMLFKH